MGPQFLKVRIHLSVHTLINSPPQLNFKKHWVPSCCKNNIKGSFQRLYTRIGTSNSWYNCKTLADNFAFVPVIHGTKLRSKSECVPALSWFKSTELVPAIHGTPGKP